MKIGCASITSPEVNQVVNSVVLSICSDMNKDEPHPDFGDVVDQFTLGIIAVDGGERNASLIKTSNRTGWYRDVRTKERVNYFDVAIGLNPDDISEMSVKSIKEFVIKRMFEKLSNIDIKIPNKFNYGEFVEYLKSILISL